MKIIKKKENKRENRLMKNIEKYKGIVLKHLSQCDIETDIRNQGGKAAIDCPHTSCEECKEKFFKWLLEEYKDPILADAERKYLSSVIKPYKNKVTGITKVKDEYKENMRYIRITVRSVGTEYINLPWFKENTMYKGMKENREYTLKELGL